MSKLVVRKDVSVKVDVVVGRCSWPVAVGYIRELLATAKPGGWSIGVKL